ncbi:RDD family protein [Peribacillus sp. TH14]|uniref:RDD family protein n=1 Tax=Peribacillus sp. TH14 TaxID=2798481 RepID=UPI00406CDFFE
MTDLNGGRIGFGRATGRYFATIISGMIFYIGYIMAGFTSKKQALHDMIAGTVVVKK